MAKKRSSTRPKVTMRLGDQLVLPSRKKSREDLDKARKAEQSSSRPVDVRRSSNRT